MHISGHITSWLNTAEEDDQRSALVRFSEEGDPQHLTTRLEGAGVTVSNAFSDYAICVVSPETLRGLFDEQWIASIEPPPGTGEPGYPGDPIDDDDD